MKDADDTTGQGGHLNAGELSALADGEPLREDRARHLAGCPACAGEMVAWRALSRGVRSLEAAPLPPGLETRVLASLRGAEGVDLPAWLAWWGRPLGLVAAALLLLVATLGVPRWLAPKPSLPEDWAWAAGLPAQGLSDLESGDDIVIDPLTEAEGDTPAPSGEAR